MTNLIRINTPNNKDIKLPAKKILKLWIAAALSDLIDNVEMDVDFVDETQSQILNQRYRHKDKPTNVLSFPLDLPRISKRRLLGNLVLCLSVVRREAIEQEKTFEHHLAHLLIHGSLHLLGYDHESTKEAQVMEALEIKTLAKLGIQNPYE